MAAILSSASSPFSGRRTHTPMRSSRRSPRTPKAASVRMIHSSMRGDEAAHVRRAALEIEHDVADALARTVIGELAAAAGDVDRKARLDQLLRPRRGAGGVKRRVLEEPDEFACLASRDRRGTGRHGGERARVVDGRVAHEPLDRRRAGGGKKANRQIAARVDTLSNAVGRREYRTGPPSQTTPGAGLVGARANCYIGAVARRLTACSPHMRSWRNW